MKNNKTKKENKNTNKFGVFNGNVINSETLANDQEFVIENYKDDSLTISEIKGPIKGENDTNTKTKKRKTNYLIYKIAAYVVILLIIVVLILWLSIYK